ncbi:MAG TPA: NAD-dependent epimerase/dehydratase family protein, partial [Anaerolineaceae bacterium]|nr:NAD-dependent epimerase/dehydratase family protein [Anaerolineaceae bacterium]
TGSHTVPLLFEKGWEVHCLHRESSDRQFLPQPEIRWQLGDLDNVENLSEKMHGCQTLVNIASLGFGHAENIITAAQSAGIERAIFISTTAIFTKLSSKSKSTRLAAEAAIQNSGLAFTILRPTMIYGSSRDRNMIRLIRWIKRLPIIPILGNGNYLQQPVYVGDVAQAILACLEEPKTIGKSYNLAGKEAITYNEVVDTIARITNRRIYKFHFPEKIIIKILRILEKIRIPFPIKSEQVERLNENKDFTYHEANEDFGYHPLSFEDGIRREIEEVLVKSS